MLFGKLSPIHTHSCLSAPSLLHSCCLEYIYLSRLSSSVLPHFSLIITSLLLVSPSAFSQFPFLSPPLVTSFFAFLLFRHTHLSSSFPLFAFLLSSSSVLSPVHPFHPDEFTCSDDEAGKCPKAKVVLVVPLCHRFTLVARKKRATLTVSVF